MLKQIRKIRLRIDKIRINKQEDGDKMSVVLNQNQLPAATTIENGAKDFGAVCDHRNIRNYDFKKPNKFTKEQIDAISLIHETFARLARTSLSAQLRTVVHVNLISVNQLTYEEYISSIAMPTTLAIIDFDPLKGSVILEIDQSITFSIIDFLAGGAGEKSEFQHELTDIERSIMEGVVVHLLGNLRAAWSSVIDSKPRLCQIETDSRFAQIVPSAEMAILVTMKAKVREVEGRINLCIPYMTMEPIIGKLSEQYCYSACCKDSPFKAMPIFKTIIPVKLTAEILKRKYSIKEISDWKEGTILLPVRPLAPDSCFLRIGERNIWQCEIIKDTKLLLRQIKVVKHVEKLFEKEDSKMEINNMTGLLKAGITISVELGSAEKTVKEAMAIGEGTIIELDTLAGEPVDVKANGVLFGKGEVVVIEKNLGVKITKIIFDQVEEEEKIEGSQND